MNSRDASDILQAFTAVNRSEDDLVALGARKVELTAALRRHPGKRRPVL